MRPIDKGIAPAVYTNYQEAGPALIGRLGDYCSYCERQSATHLAVEHKKPKSLNPALRNDWANFLLGCVNCNSCKGGTPVNLPDYFWPDMDNTLRALEYIRGGLVHPNSTLPPAMHFKAQATIILTGLDKDPGNPGREPSSRDLRWKKRQEAWKFAERARHHLTLVNTPELREQIIDAAISRGMFSIWWTVFADDVDMRQRLRQAFTGTHSGSFDANEDLQQRLGGQI